MIEEGRTQTAQTQRRLEKKLQPEHEELLSLDNAARLERLRLKRDVHVEYLHQHYGLLPEMYAALDASQPWILYWNVHSLALLGASLPDGVQSEGLVEFLRSCWSEKGGYGGGPRQLPHLAPTYAAVMALMTIGTNEALQSIDRCKLQDFLLSMCIPKEKGGGMTVHEDGEIDVRGCYCAIAVAHVLNLDKYLIAERSDMVDFIRRCQSFEGGLGGEPGNEAHGGYTFCGLAALHLLNRVDVLNVAALTRWAVHMQGSFEGGFIGRTHKLVDGCYSYWQGAIFALLEPFTKDPDLWSNLVPDFEIQDELDDLPSYEHPEPPSNDKAAREDAEERLKQRARELGLDLKQALTDLSIDPAASTVDRRVRMDLFRSTFEDSRTMIRSTQLTFPAMFPIDSDQRRSIMTHNAIDHEVLFDAAGLQFWVLMHCQMEEGGLRDKPNKEADLYHTCYCLSGLAVAQHHGGVIVGPKENALLETDPVLNIITSKAQLAMAFYRALDL